MTDEQHDQERPEETIDDLEAPDAAQADVAGGTFHIVMKPPSGGDGPPNLPGGGTPTGAGSSNPGN